MLPFSDSRWSELLGGRRELYDPRLALARLERNEQVDATWAELWDNLHHQGDVDAASYAAAPHLVRIHGLRGVPDWNTYAMLGTIELERSRRKNPPLPEWLREGYEQAWRDVMPLALRDLAHSDDPLLARSALGVFAIGRGLRGQGEALLHLTDDELEELLAIGRGD